MMSTFQLVTAGAGPWAGRTLRLIEESDNYVVGQLSDDADGNPGAVVAVRKADAVYWRAAKAVYWSEGRPVIEPADG